MACSRARTSLSTHGPEKGGVGSRRGRGRAVKARRSSHSLSLPARQKGAYETRPSAARHTCLPAHGQPSPAPLSSRGGGRVEPRRTGSWVTRSSCSRSQRWLLPPHETGRAWRPRPAQIAPVFHWVVQVTACALDYGQARPSTPLQGRQRGFRRACAPRSCSAARDPVHAPAAPAYAPSDLSTPTPRLHCYQAMPL